METALAPITPYDGLRRLVVDALTSPVSKRVYGVGLDTFFRWYAETQPATGFSKATVNAFRSHLLERGLSASTVNLYLAAVKKLAREGADNGHLSQETAGAISRVAGVKKLGTRTGNWLGKKQAEKLIKAPNADTLKGKRDRAILAVLVGCGLRRRELSILRMDHIQQREGRWVLVDIVGKGGRIRSVPMPAFAKAAIDSWVNAAGVTGGRVFRSISKRGRVGEGLTPQAVFLIVREYAEQIDSNVRPHDLRRTFAKLAYKGDAPVDQIMLSLGHGSMKTTEGYLGFDQDWGADAPCDHLGLKLSMGT